MVNGCELSNSLACCMIRAVIFGENNHLIASSRDVKYLDVSYCMRPSTFRLKTIRQPENKDLDCSIILLFNPYACDRLDMFNIIQNPYGGSWTTR